MNDYNLKNKVIKIKKREERLVKRKILNNMVKSFIVGGLICAIAEGIYLLFNLGFNEKDSNNYTIMIIIMIASLLTGFGIFDRIGQFAGCGTIVPITGFANSMTSSAMESKSEGIVVGILNNMFKLAGSVISVAIISGVFVGIITYLIDVIFG